MRIPRAFHRGGVSACSRLVAAAATVAASAALLCPVAFATPAHASDPPVGRVCDTPRPGQFGCFAMRRLTDVKSAKGLLGSAPPEGLSPGDLRGAYGLPADGGKGATIAVVAAQDNPSAEADMAVYRRQFGLPECRTDNGCFSKVDQNGGHDYPVARAGWAAEISLDLQMISAVAPRAHIVLVEAATPDFDDLGAAVNQAVSQGAQFVSNSYGSGYSSTAGSGEDPALTSWMDAYYNHPGVTVVASSGDSGYGVSYPASSQYVTAVGGTSLVKDDSARGWSEKAWAGSGSGCSLHSLKPGFQKDTNCARRTVTDVAAVADPATGVAVYNSFKSDGWSVYGGTSASAPIITGVYANAGKPLAGTYPNSYPYAKSEALNDVTEGVNGGCPVFQTYLCRAAAGYDGPTGLGTPKGPDAFRAGPQGEITGTVVGSRGRPVASAEVRAGDYRATTDVKGAYSLVVPPGTYTVTAAAFGFHSSTPLPVKVVEDRSAAYDARLRAVARQTVEGTVKDASGHGWPLYAKITVDGVPGGPVYSDARTGRFRVELPEGADYTLHAAPVYPGYQEADRKVTLGSRDVHTDLDLKADATKCYAPGYGPTDHGLREGFESGATPDGWTVTDADTDGGGWEFTSARLNITGDSGKFAIVDSSKLGPGKTQDTYLTSPPVDMSGIEAPHLSFDTYYLGLPSSEAAADASVDGGKTWTTVWESTQNVTGKRVTVDLPQAEGRTDVRARFHYTGAWSQWWEIDDVQLGSTTCDPRAGALVVGEVTDATTHEALPAATVTVPGDDAASGTTATLPDPLADGAFYWLFSKETGARHLTATAYRHTDAEPALDLAADRVTQQDIALESGRIEMNANHLAATLAPGDSHTSYVTVKNTGTAPATVHLGVDSDGYTPAVSPGTTATRHVKPDVTTGPQAAAALKMSKDARRDTQQAMDSDAGPAADGWTRVADYPTKVSGNIVDSHEGTLYSGLGYTGPVTLDTNAFYAYDPAKDAWQEREFPHDAREAAAHGFVDGKLYVTGGWVMGRSKADARTEVYDPDTDTWTTATSSPAPYGGSGSAVLDGKLYVVGGCDETGCGTKDTWTYEPSSGEWHKVAAYPEPIAWQSCGTLSGSVYCAGGTGPDGATAHAYRYSAKADTWVPIADLPAAVWGSACATGGGRLLVQNGVVDGAVTHQGWAYDPASDTWSALPNSPQASYRYGAATGLYTVGGSTSATQSLSSTLLLPGYGRADDTAGWLTLDGDDLTLAPGRSAKVKARFSAGDATPVAGTYGATVHSTTDTPFSAPKLRATLTVRRSGS
ncbi:carboxypeptidase regulatory-like domain-containing protein [Streptomyces sp. NPDC051453]|uniref:Kelch repeat-containing protein n=1 Tax=Streptomyces sp. NPDC051453 TaxID=3154941 RepID=UPI0034157BA4